MKIAVIGSRNIIDVAELFHDNNILVVSQSDPLEEVPNIKELPKIDEVTEWVPIPNNQNNFSIFFLEKMHTVTIELRTL